MLLSKFNATHKTTFRKEIQLKKKSTYFKYKVETYEKTKYC